MRLTPRGSELSCRWPEVQQAPVAATEAGVPCFPVATEVGKPEVSVRDAPLEPGPASQPSPNRPPTLEELGGWVIRSNALGPADL